MAKLPHTLKSHGIVDDRSQGNLVYYRLLTPCVVSFFECAGAAKVLEERGNSAVALRRFAFKKS